MNPPWGMTNHPKVGDRVRVVIEGVVVHVDDVDDSFDVDDTGHGGFFVTIYEDAPNVTIEVLP